MAAQAEAADHHLALLVGQLGQPQVDALPQILILQQFAGIGRMIVGQGIQQGLVGVRTEGDVHRGHPLVQAQHALDLGNRLFQQRGDFIGGGFVIELLRQLTGGTQIDVEFLDHMNRQTDGARLVHDRPFDGLANPPGGVGGEAETALGIELLDRADQAEVALLDQVEQGQAAIDVTPRDLHHQTQVALDHALAPSRFAATGHAREMHFLFRAEQRRETDFVEVELGGIQCAGVVDKLVLPRTAGRGGASDGLNLVVDIQREHFRSDTQLHQEHFIVTVEFRRCFCSCHFFSVPF
ncbi:hypothetical protein D3C78_802110 [compost metagenome]